MQSAPTENQINHWVQTAKQKSARMVSRGSTGETEIDQGYYTSIAGDHADLARALFLRDHDVKATREQYLQASQLTEHSFRMAFDESAKDYLGNDADYSEVDEVVGMEGMHWALCAADFTYANEFAQWPRLSPDDDPLPQAVCNYVYGLKHFLLGEEDKARILLTKTLKKYQDKAPPKSGHPKNYYTLCLTLMGILNKDEAMFNDGLSQQLKFYRGLANGELIDTDEQYICDKAVALANLAIHHGLKVTYEGDYLPKGLLTNK